MKIPRLREHRERRGLTQARLAEVSGLSQRSISGWEGGREILPPKALALALALDVSIDELMGVEYPPSPGAWTPPVEPPATPVTKLEPLGAPQGG